MTVEIPIQGQSASGGNSGGANPPVQPPIPPVQPPTQPPVTPNTNLFGGRDTGYGTGGSVGGSERMYERGDIGMNGRMVEDVRREMQQRGVLMIPGSSSMSQVINQYGTNLRKSESGRIHNEYEDLRTASKEQRDRELKRIGDEAKKEAQKYVDLRDAGVMTNEEARDAYSNSPVRKKLEEEAKIVQREYKSDIKSINEAEDKDQLDADKDLTKAIRDLTRYFEREARENVNEDSFLNKLKKEREQAIFERDNAEDEEAARESAKRVNELNDKIKSVMEGEEDEEPEKKD